LESSQKARTTKTEDEPSRENSKKSRTSTQDRSREKRGETKRRIANTFKKKHLGALATRVLRRTRKGLE